jgi:hypothetical protein
LAYLGDYIQIKESTNQLKKDLLVKSMRGRRTRRTFRYPLEWKLNSLTQKRKKQNATLSSIKHGNYKSIDLNIDDVLKKQHF